MISTGASAVTPAQFRRTLGFLPSGITVVTTVDGAGLAHGMTASSFVSLSLEPPLVQWSLARKAWSHPLFSAATHFAVSVLAADQEDVSRRFSSPGVDRFAGTATEAGLHGLPLIAGSLAWLECRTVEQLAGGDHTIFIGEVLRCRTSDKTPLLHWRGRYLPISQSMAEQGHHAGLDYLWW